MNNTLSRYNWFQCKSNAIAALGVSGIVIWIGIRLAKETIDTLVDRAPDELAPQIPRSVECPLLRHNLLG